VPVRSHPKLEPITVNVTPSIRVELERIANREILSLSDVVRRACRFEIERSAERDEEQRDGR
jgi:hypothetical protein